MAKKNSNYIFTFGNIGVGKSTIMAALSRFFSLSTAIHINPKNPGGTAMMINWVGNLNKKEFPPRSRKGDIFEIDMGIEFTKGNGENVQITFLEMSGEDLINVDLREKDSRGDLDTKFKDYVNISELFLVVTDIERAAEDDLLVWQFFNLLISCGARVTTVAVIISKWDLNTGETNLEKFVKEKMPITHNWLNSDYIDDARVFSFSIGIPDSRENKIVELNLEDTKKIATWIYQTLTN